jgi:asparagine synthase (glutamine-hydrolysing)
MTALVGVFGTEAMEAGSRTPGSSRVLDAMLARMENRGAAVPELFATPGALIASRRHAWEGDEPGWTGPVITVADDWVVAADASLYYLADLRRKLAPFQPVARETTLGELIVATLRTWGDRFARHLEGDFAILAWHRPTGRLLLARDFAGKRSLTYGRAPEGSLVVASSPRAVVAYPGMSRAYDAHFIAVAIAGLHGHGTRTAFADVSVVPGGATIALEGDRVTTIDQWLPPSFSSEWEEKPSDQAADELRQLLEDAVYERLPSRGTAAVWMSGGWDSTSLFAAGRSALDRRAKTSIQLKPISMRYPEGDTGDESGFIESVARRWKTDVRWVPVDSMPLFEDANRRAAVRDDPRVSPFESQIRTLCAVSRELGVRVVQDGAGGDHLFMVSSAAVLADHVFAGRVNALWREWKGWGTAYRWIFARSALLPQFSASTLQWIGTVRGRPLFGFWNEAIPPWVRLTADLVRETTPHIERESTEGVSAWETRRVLTTPLLPRALSWTHPMALEEGILLRSPFFDRRLIDFTATRPLNERGGGIDAKVVLRRAMRDLLPSDVLDARTRKTGTPADYFKRQMLASARFEFEKLFEGRKSRLEDLGIIDLVSLKTAMSEYQKTGSHTVGAVLQLTIEAERWLAAQDLAL